MYNDRKPGRELDGTAASSANDRLEEILRRVKDNGANITLDETMPLIIDFNMEMVEIGVRRVVEFNVNKTDFQIIRDVKNCRMSGGSAYKKHLEAIDRPIIETKLKRKSETSDQWIGVDIEDVF